ncbi:MAG: hypothetical protein AAF393_14490 [Pseudomonadota bacterium]
MPWFSGENSTLPDAKCAPGRVIVGVGNWDFGGGAQSAYFICADLPPGVTLKEPVWVPVTWTPGGGQKAFGLCNYHPGRSRSVAVGLKLIDAGNNNQYIGVVFCAEASTLPGNTFLPVRDVE